MHGHLNIKHSNSFIFKGLDTYQTSRPLNMMACDPPNYSYYSITDWQHRSGWYSGALYTESDESSWHATGSISKVSSNIIPLIYDYIPPSDR